LAQGSRGGPGPQTRQPCRAAHGGSALGAGRVRRALARWWHGPMGAGGAEAAVVLSRPSKGLSHKLGDLSDRGHLEAFAASSDSDDDSWDGDDRGAQRCGPPWARQAVVAVLGCCFLLFCGGCLYVLFWGHSRIPLVPFDAPSLNFWAIWSGDNTSEENIALWAEYQAKMVSYLNTQFWQGQPNVSLRILVINPVQNSNLSLENFIRNYDKLTNNSFGDVFHFALFFYQGSDSLFEEYDWTSVSKSGPVVFSSKERICKAEAWYQITPAMAAKYDYLWLIDGDLGMDLFSWDLYRTVLVNTEALISQPSVVPKGRHQRSSDLDGLNMYHWKLVNHSMPVYIEIGRTEIMCTVVSSQLWPSFYNRLEHTDRLSAWFTSDFWDFAALLSRLDCGRPAPLLVNAAPVRHLNFHDLFTGGRCSKHCGSDGSNCKNPSATEMSLMTKSLASSSSCGRADIQSLEATCTSDFQMRGCRSYLGELVENYTMLLYSDTVEPEAEKWAFYCKETWPEQMTLGKCHPELLHRLS